MQDNEKAVDNWLPILNIPEGKAGKFSIKHKVTPAMEEITVVSMRTALFAGQKPMVIKYDSPMTYTYLCEPDGVWMSDTPPEQIQHKEVAKKCSGRILVGGLGLGLVATMLAKKKSVTSIVVIEKEKDVIDLVWKHLDLKGKGEIIHQDLFDYLKQDMNKEHFDYCYFDIWSPDSERVLYEYVIPLRKLALKYVDSVSRIICWQEDIMRGQLLTNIATSIMFNWDKILEMNSKDFDDIYGKWDRPQYAFWNWVRETKPDQEVAKFMMHRYVKRLGTEAWRKEWEKWDMTKDRQIRMSLKEKSSVPAEMT